MMRLVYDPELAEADLAQAEDGGVAEGHDLETAALISLFTDRRVAADEVPEDRDRAGWWADAIPDNGEAEDPIGSRLWLLTEHGRLTADAPARARAYAIEALEWMVEDGIARAVDATAVANGRGRLDLTITITLTDGARKTYSFEV